MNAITVATLCQQCVLLYRLQQKGHRKELTMSLPFGVATIFLVYVFISSVLLMHTTHIFETK